MKPPTQGHKDLLVITAFPAPEPLVIAEISVLFVTPYFLSSHNTSLHERPLFPDPRFTQTTKPLQGLCLARIDQLSCVARLLISSFFTLPDSPRDEQRWIREANLGLRPRCLVSGAEGERNVRGRCHDCRDARRAARRESG